MNRNLNTFLNLYTVMSLNNLTFAIVSNIYIQVGLDFEK